MAKIGKTTVLTAPVLVDRQLNVIQDGCVVIQGERTMASGRRGSISIPGGAQVIELKDSLLMPGLVNAHCHLDYTAMKGAVPAAGGFAPWVTRIVEKKRTWSDANYRESIQAGIAESLKYGTTLIANITCVPHLVSSLDLEGAPRIWWFVEQLDLGRPLPAEPWEPYLTPRFPRQQFSLSPHAPYSVTPELFKRAISFCDRHALPWTAHVAESKDEWEMFHDATGPLFELVKKTGRDMSDCGNTTPFARVLELNGSARANALLAHMNCISDEDLARLGLNRERFSIAHCPRSHDYFRHPPFRLNELRKAGVNLALGTDSLASNSDLSMFSEMRKMSASFPDLSPQAIVAMATRNGAQALGEGQNWAHWADWIAIPDMGGEPFKTIIQFADSPKFVMVGGVLSKN